MHSTASQFKTGRVSNIGTTGIQIFDDQTARAMISINIYCPTGNDGTIYISDNSGVTADSDDDTDGYPVSADDTLELKIRNPQEVWAIADSGVQKLFYLIV